MAGASSPLSDSPFVRALSRLDREALDAIARPRWFEADELLVHEGQVADSIHLIAAGHVAAETGAGDDRVMLVVMGPGEVFGELALVDGRGRRTADVRALDETQSLVIERATFERLRVRSPTVDRFVVALLAARVRRLSDHLFEALHVAADVRVARRLLSLVRVYGPSQPVEVPLRQDQLAQLAGTTRPTVNRALRALEDRGGVRLGRGRVTIVDRAVVHAAATEP